MKMFPNYNDDLEQNFPRIVVLGEKTFVVPQVIIIHFKPDYRKSKTSFIFVLMKTTMTTKFRTIGDISTTNYEIFVFSF